MRFGLVHRTMTNTLAALGVLAIVSSASMNPWVSGLCAFGLIIAVLVPERFQQKPWLAYLATGGPLLLFCVEGGRLLSGQSALDIAVEFAALLQIVRLATRRGAAHDQQIILLALLHFVVGTVLGGGLAFGLCFVGFLMIAPGALMLSHLRREVEGNYRQGARDRTGLPVDVPRILRSRRVVGRGFLLSTGLLSVPIFLFTATLFLVFPRVGLSLLLINHSRSGRMVGFSDRVDLGDVGMLRSDPSIALRFEVPNLPDLPPPRLTLRLRGTAFDTYDGRAWARTLGERRPETGLAGTYAITRLPRPSDRLVRFDLEPIDPPVLFFPSQSVAFQLRTRSGLTLGEPTVISRGPEGEFRYAGADTRGIRYEVYVAPDDEVISATLPENERSHYLGLPRGITQRISALAEELTRDEPTARGKARILEEHLKKQYAYDTNSPSGGTSDPVAHFLFESKKGHCEFFSTSMAVMLRTLHIPSRNVTGFVGGTYNRFGKYYAVREGDAHSWVEAYIEDGVRSGWYTFDPTPNAGAQPLHATAGAWVYMRDFVEAMSQRWNAHIVGYDLRQQLHILDTVTTRYNQARRNAGFTKGPGETLTRPSVVACGFLLIAAASYLYWRRRTTGAIQRPKSPQKEAVDPQSLASLYRSLEHAMQQHGLIRKPEEPPLRFAEGLANQGHPLATEITSLTNIYLGARFGGTTLSPAHRRDFDLRVRELRSQRLQVP
jgi:protein-glutamine gamma-glutamyltransferase